MWIKEIPFLEQRFNHNYQILIKQNIFFFDKVTLQKALYHHHKKSDVIF